MGTCVLGGGADGVGPFRPDHAVPGPTLQPVPPAWRQLRGLGARTARRAFGASGWSWDESVGWWLGVDGGVVALLCVGGVAPGGWLMGLMAVPALLHGGVSELALPVCLEECAAENAGVGASQRVRSPDGEAQGNEAYSQG